MRGSIQKGRIVSPYRNLLDGVRSFQEQVIPQHRALFESLADGQSPDTLFITCSDSRVDPSLLTQTMPGELFIIRNAGNIVPPKSAGVTGASAGIEYAVRVLRVKHIVVCGHSRCGAMQGLLDSTGLDELHDVREWIRYAEGVRDAVLKHKPPLDEPHRLAQAVELNVLLQLDHLRTLPAVREALDAGTLDLNGWVYKFETGDLDVYDPQRKRFVPSTDISPTTA